MAYGLGWISDRRSLRPQKLVWGVALRLKVQGRLAGFQFSSWLVRKLSSLMVI
jgi:hypothetical protein